MSVASEMFRKECKKNDSQRFAGFKTPNDIVRYDDILYGTDPKWHVLDVYRPKSVSTKEKLPVIVSFHGGGWVYGDKELYQWYGMDLAQRGFAVVNYTYRLAPEFQFPAPLEDTNLVFTWVMKHAEEYGLDVDNIFAVGDSAGGHGVGLYAGILTNPEFADTFAFSVPEGLKLRAIAINCGVAEVKITGDPEDLTQQLMGDYLPNGGDANELDIMSVVHHVTENYPPTYIMTAMNDFLKMEAPIFARSFSEHNVPFTYVLYGTKEEPLQHVFHCDIHDGAAKKCNDDECRFFREHMA